MGTTDADARRRISDARCVALIYLCSFAFLFLLIANPGYFSHDELQRFDFFVQHGFAAYVEAHSQLHVGSGFGFPVRPFSFFVQGLQNFFLRDFPVFVHLSGVLVTATVASLLYLLSSAFGLPRKLGLAAALIFLASPLSVLATGWSAALMDQWYVLFGLLALAAARRLVDGTSAGYAELAAIFACSVLALLSKETAIVLPLLLSVFVVIDRRRLRDRRLWLAFAAWSLPVVAYAAFRFLAIKSSFATGGASPYSASIAHIPESLFVYFAFPFHPNIAEASTWVFQSRTALALALGFHALVVACIWRLASLRAAVAYLAGYFIFLFPVLFIAMKGSHYLFGSSLVLSLAVAFLATGASAPGRLVGLVAGALLVVHSATMQMEIYRDGSCMDRLAESAESLYLSNGRPQAIEFSWEGAAPAHVLHRYVTGRDQIGIYYPVRLTAVEPGAARADGALRVVMNKDCIAFSR
jgi:hypothetical protein